MRVREGITGVVHRSITQTESMVCTNAQVDSRDIRPIVNEMRGGGFLTRVDCRFLNGLVHGSIPFLRNVFIIHVTPRDPLQTISVINMLRVGGVEERELRILTLILADSFFETDGVCRFYGERGCPFDDGYMRARQGKCPS